MITAINSNPDGVWITIFGINVYIESAPYLSIRWEEHLREMQDLRQAERLRECLKTKALRSGTQNLKMVRNRHWPKTKRRDKCLMSRI